MAKRMMLESQIIDCHCHAGKGDRMTAPWNTVAPIKAYLRRARAAGIDKTIVIPPFHSNYDEANAELGQVVARYRTGWWDSLSFMPRGMLDESLRW
jgi:hypothetical protein